MSSPSPRALVGLALAGLVTSSVVPMASAGEEMDGDGDHGQVVASGLASPRHLTATSRGDLYVAEAGAGGTDCVDVEGTDENGEPTVSQMCAGTTGGVTMVARDGGQMRVVSGLPSLMLGTEPIGPSGVAVHGSSLMISVGLGNDPALRDAFVGEHGEVYERFATVQSAKLKGRDAPVLRTEADLARFETHDNPDKGLLDTNPNSITKDRNGWLVADAGGNYVGRLDNRDRVSVVAVMPGGMADAPPFLRLPPETQIPFQSVPTAAVRGRDGAVYVSQLTGFPFPPGGAAIWRVGEDGVPTVWATGLTNVTDLAFDTKGHLYAVQISDAGLLNEDPTALPSGSLVRVTEGASMHTTVADNLPAPFGVALHKDDAYVTTCTVCVDGGQVVRFDLDD